ncbi:MAG: ABC transporter substrate-binding protein [Acidimicrobiales bacterium]
MNELLERVLAKRTAVLLGLFGAVGVLLVAAVVGAIAVSNDHGHKASRLATSSIGPSGGSPNSNSTDNGLGAPGATTASTGATGGVTGAGPNTPGRSVSGVPGSSGTIGAGGGVVANNPNSSGGTNGPAPNTAGATRIGVFKDHIEWGLHAPKTVNGIPLPIADDPLKGVQIYLAAINNAGGVNGRKINEDFADDRYTVDGAKTAADTLINDKKVFFLSGTLGVDQIAVVAAAARNAKPAPVPYMAAGGSENAFKDIGMFQIAGSYDTHLELLAKFLAAESAKPPNQSIYSGRHRVGVSALASQYITNGKNASVENFKKAVEATGTLKWAGIVTVPKYTDPSNTHNYGDQIQRLEAAKAEIVVPAQDPLTTSNEVQQCVVQRCPWVWTMSDFAHDDDVALGLIAPHGEWAGVRGLSSGCYYEEYRTARAAHCAMLKPAHDAWVSVNGQSDWDQHGQGGLAGYQVVHFWLKALKDAGTDPTRERLSAALGAYDNYDDLVTGPITFRGSPNVSHGVEVMSTWEAGSNSKWRQISDSLAGSF